MRKSLHRVLAGLLVFSALVQVAPNHVRPVRAAIEQAQPAQTQQTPPPATTATRSKKPVAKATTGTEQPVLSNDNHYTNSSGNRVHSPAKASSVPTGATAVCGDGSYSFSQHHQGTCSRHGGVSRWL
jgi:hypothetical protein